MAPCHMFVVRFPRFVKAKDDAAHNDSDASHSAGSANEEARDVEESPAPVVYKAYLRRTMDQRKARADLRRARTLSTATAGAHSDGPAATPTETGPDADPAGGRGAANQADSGTSDGANGTVGGRASGADLVFPGSLSQPIGKPAVVGDPGEGGAGAAPIGAPSFSDGSESVVRTDTVGVAAAPGDGAAREEGVPGGEANGGADGDPSPTDPDDVGLYEAEAEAFSARVEAIKAGMDAAVRERDLARGSSVPEGGADAANHEGDARALAPEAATTSSIRRSGSSTSVAEPFIDSSLLKGVDTARSADFHMAPETLPSASPDPEGTSGASGAPAAQATASSGSTSRNGKPPLAGATSGAQDNRRHLHPGPWAMPRNSAPAAQNAPSVSAAEDGPDDDLAPREFTIDLLGNLIESLLDLGVTDAIVSPDATGTWVSVTFTVTGITRQVWMTLTELGIGHQFGTACVLDVPLRTPAQEPMSTDNLDEEAKSAILFTVDKVLREAKVKAQFSFDYGVLLVVAAAIAGLGLATNNAVAIVASMLVSPLMGPIMAATFGSVTREWSTVRVGVRTELLSLAICILIGMLLGLIFEGGGWGRDFDWPTAEMSGRGTPSAVYLGIAIGFVSGIGAAVSIIGSDSVGLVGVAISASLLPPAVNTGMLLAYSWVLTGEVTTAAGEVFTSRDLSVHGGYSFLLVVVNIIAIYIAAFATYRFKEIAPLPNKSEFWTRGVKRYREQTHRKLTVEEQEEWKKMRARILRRRNDALGRVRTGADPVAGYVSSALNAQGPGAVAVPTNAILAQQEIRRLQDISFAPPSRREYRELRRVERRKRAAAANRCESEEDSGA